MSTVSIVLFTVHTFSLTVLFITVYNASNGFIVMQNTKNLYHPHIDCIAMLYNYINHGHLVHFMYLYNIILASLWAIPERFVVGNVYTIQVYLAWPPELGMGVELILIAL